MSTRENPILEMYNESGVNVPVDEKILDQLLQQISINERATIRFLEWVCVDEDQIIELNKEYFNRDYITDTITLRHDDFVGKENIEGTIYCCGPRIFEQAEELSEQVDREFYRIFVHGVLHLIGYEDETDSKKKQMSELEDRYLNFISF